MASPSQGLSNQNWMRLEVLIGTLGDLPEEQVDERTQCIDSLFEAVGPSHDLQEQ